MAGLAFLLKRRTFQAGSPFTCSRGPIKAHQLCLDGEVYLINARTKADRRAGGQKDRQKKRAEKDKPTNRLRRMERDKQADSRLKQIDRSCQTQGPGARSVILFGPPR